MPRLRPVLANFSPEIPLPQTVLLEDGDRMVLRNDRELHLALTLRAEIERRFEEVLDER